MSVQFFGSAQSGQSLAVVDNIPAFTSSSTPTALTDIPGSLTAQVTVPASGRLRVEGHSPWISLTGGTGVVVFLIYEALVTAGVTGAFAAVASSITNITTTSTGIATSAIRPLSRTPGNIYVYKLQIYRSSGTGNPFVSNLALGGGIFLDVTAR